MIFLFTDFGLEGPYLGQMKAVLHARAPGVPVVDLMADVPAFDPQAGAHLLAALVPGLPSDAVFLCVVDPGVGTARGAVVLAADGRLFVGPDNGLLAIAAGRAARASWWRIDWRPARLSASFHGRDLFAPVAARLAAEGETALPSLGVPALPAVGADWPAELARIVYVDRYGNAMTGLRAAALPPGAAIAVAGRRLPRRRTFAEGRPGEPFWYENSSGLVEIAVDRARADAALGIGVGTAVEVSA